MHRESSINHRDPEIVPRPVVSRKPQKHEVDPDMLLKKTTGRRPMLALLIAGYNEELVIGNTIRSAIRAGMEREHIYVVDDNSSDQTSAIARSILGPNNVLKVDRSGKGLALTKGAKHFDLTRRYSWIHIADADGGFSPDYFKIFRSRLRVKYVAATGYVRSLPGGPISQYRVLEYTIGQEIHRRFQALTHTVTVIPGPTSCFRSDIFRQVDFANKSLTEDFDVTLQIHRRKLGKIQFIPQAIAYTQDPSTLKDYTKQITRWNRGVMQGIQRHGVGKHFNRLDAYLSYQVAQNLLFFAGYCVYVPYEAFVNHSPNVIALTFLYDVFITFATTVLVAMKARRPDILSAFPHIYAFRWISTFVFLRAFAEVVFLRRFRVTEGFWSPPTRTKNPTSA
jgi:cellulose synthase/poly-beta-1,6-N-acetylglucosamine synthase-like glycosyltransferase